MRRGQISSMVRGAACLTSFSVATLMLDHASIDDNWCVVEYGAEDKCNHFVSHGYEYQQAARSTLRKKETHMQWSPEWDLSTIPEDKFKSERARRQVAKRKTVGNTKLGPCPKCGRMLTTRQRRLPCPLHIPPLKHTQSEDMEKAAPAVSRSQAVASLQTAIVAQGPQGPGVWSVSPQGRFGVTLNYVAPYQDMLDGYSQEDRLIEAVWQDLGGVDILARAGLAGEYKNGSILAVNESVIHFWAAIPVQD